MRTIGARLTVLYVVAVAGAIVTVLLLGRYLLERHLLRDIDARLQTYYEQIRDRFSTDTGPDDVRGLLAASGISGDLNVQVDDLWRESPGPMSATHGPPPADTNRLRFSQGNDAAGNAVRIGEGTSGALRIRLSLPLQPIQNALHDYTRVAGGIALLVLIMSFLAGRLLSRTALQPVRMIEHTAARIGSDNLSERIPLGAVEDEISNLARILNETFDRLESSFDQIRRFSADASHELKTPLSLVRLNIERVILGGRLDRADAEALHEAIEEIHWMDRLIENLLFLSRVEAGEVGLQWQPVETGSFIEQFGHDARLLAESAGLQLRISANEPGSVHADPARLRQVLLNLLSNAIKFTPPGGQIHLSSRQGRDCWILEVCDEGPGIPENMLGSIFRRFAQIPGQAPGRPRPEAGAGLGLAICKSIIELHGGRISASNRPDRSGLVFRCELPLRP
jgi:signal transduction histidine kinase